MSVEEVLRKHEDLIQDYARSHFGSPIPEKNMFREVVSGETIDSRPQMKLVLKLMESDQYKAVLVVEPQRLSRGDLEDCGRLINTLRYSNTLVLTLTHSYDLQQEYERKFFEMEITRGNDYLEYTKQILRRGREASAAKGHYIGSVDPYGYRKTTVKVDGVTCHTLEIVPEEAEAVKLIHELYAYTPAVQASPTSLTNSTACRLSQRRLPTGLLPSSVRFSVIRCILAWSNGTPERL